MINSDGVGEYWTYKYRHLQFKVQSTYMSQLSLVCKYIQFIYYLNA